jgi:hypothetical protein
MLRITRYIESLITALNDSTKLAFTKTAERHTETHRASP